MTGIDLDRIVEALQAVLPEDGKPVALHEPSFSGNEWIYVKECLDTGWVSSAGKFVDKFENMLVDFTGVKHAIAVVNGTAGLHICLKLLDVNPGDEVLVPALTFVATANTVIYCGAIPHFVDSEKATLGLAPDKLSDYLQNISVVRTDGCYNKITGRRIKAVIPMHTFGHPVDLEPLVEVCNRYRLELIEDAAESIGSYYRGRHTGSLGKLAVLSFNGNKTITTGGGGAILTNSAELGKMAKHLTTTAKTPHKWTFTHDYIGYNYRLPNINAALGCAQLEGLPVFLSNKRKLAEKYKKVFDRINGINFFMEPPFAKSNYWLNVLLLEEIFSDQRDILLEMTNNAGIMTRPAWTLMNKLPMFKDCPRMDLSTAESLERTLVNIPSSAKL